MTEGIKLEEFFAGRLKSNLEDFTILIVGMGGLGCELLKNFLFSGFRKIHIIDMDTIEISNLNRQFLFTKKDVGKAKVEVAAAYFASQFDPSFVTAHFCAIQEKDASFYRQFDAIVSGLDSIEARRWLNAMAHSLLRYHTTSEEHVSSATSLDHSSVIPLIDGGTEGLRGSVRVILPGITACFECTIGLFPPRTKVPICTLSNKPRRFEHCLEWSTLVHWKETAENDGLFFDPDNFSHIQWAIEEAKKRAKEFGISYSEHEASPREAQRLLKNIVPAVSSTNSIIAAMCCNEVIKLVSEYGRSLNNFFLYNGTEGVYGSEFENERLMERENGGGKCLVCSACNNEKERCHSLTGAIAMTSLVGDLVELLRERYHLIHPSIRTSTKSVFFSMPVSLYEETKGNLEETIGSFVDAEEEHAIFYVSDSTLPQVISFRL